MCMEILLTLKFLLLRYITNDKENKGYFYLITALNRKSTYYKFYFLPIIRTIRGKNSKL